MIDYLFKTAPFVIAFIVYFIRLEVKLASISNDLCWIKKIVREILRDQTKICEGEKDHADNHG